MKRNITKLVVLLLLGNLWTPHALEAASLVWNGAGADNYWSTSGNWTGAALANGDTLTFGGMIRTRSTNDLANLSVGGIQFNNGGFTLTGNPVTVVAGGGLPIITSAGGVNTIANDMAITTPGRYWSVAPGSEVRLTGALTNTSAGGVSIGWLNLTNGGTVRIMNSARSARGMDLFNGTLIVDGGYVDATADGLCFKPPTGSTMLLQVTNNGTVRVGGGGNLRIGNSRTGLGSAAGAGSLSQVDIYSGTIELYGNASMFVGDNVVGVRGVVNQYGGLVSGAGTGNNLTIGNAIDADGTYNLNGGILRVPRVRQGNVGATNVVFNFNGGTLMPAASSATFMQELLQANVLSGGALIDVAEFDVTIAQNLQGSGALKKLGSGRLTLSGACAHTGGTIVSNGTLVVSPSTLTGSGALTVSGGSLTVSNISGAVSVSSFVIGGAGTSALNLDFSAGHPGFAPIVAGSVNGSAGALINITGQGFMAGQFPLVQFTSASGLGNIHLGSVPPGVSATLVQTPTSLDLKITSVVRQLAWSGAVNNLWNTTAQNWLDINNGYLATSYAETGSFGDMVIFEDGAFGSTSIALNTTVSPVNILFNNHGLSYSISGSGKISGVGSVRKEGFQPATLSTVNDYTGGTVINAGVMFIGANQALGLGPVTLNFGSLASDGVNSRTLPNKVILNADAGVSFGDPSTTGPLVISGSLDLGGAANRELSLISDLIVTGTIENGGFSTITGPGRFIITGDGKQDALVTQREGDVIIDGGVLDSLDGWRLQNYISGTRMLLAITNGGSLFIRSTTANLRIGLAGGDNTADNIVDIAGTVSLAPSLPSTANNGVLLGLSGANSILRLRAGGLLVCRSIVGNAPANTEVYFDGGTLVPLANHSSFIDGITNVFIENGGLMLDTTNDVTISQALLANGSGGLVKAGTGTLTLLGANTYAGRTLVNAGKLVLGPNHNAKGGIGVAPNAVLAFQSTDPELVVRVSGVTNAAGSALEARFGGLTGKPTAPAGFVTNLVLNGTVAVNVSGAGQVGTYPLFGYQTIGGVGNLVLGQLPHGVMATLATNTVAKTIDLQVNAVDSLVWTGATSGNWDLTSTNWAVNGVPLAFVQGDYVRFDDSGANPAVSVSTALTPSGVVISNNSLSYELSGAGALSGSMNLIKQGSGPVRIGMANSFVGEVSIREGLLVAERGRSLGALETTVTISNGATFDMNLGALNGAGFGIQPFVVSGAGYDGHGAVVNTGVDQNNAFRNVTLLGDTTVGGTALIGLRTSAEEDLGLIANGFKLTKVGTGSLALNGGTATAGLTKVWFTDLGDIEIKEGMLSFQRRAAMGLPNNLISVHPGATLQVFSLSTEIPVPQNRISLTNATLRSNGGTGGDINTLGGQIVLNGSSNVITTLVGTPATTFTFNGPLVGSGSAYFNGSIVLNGNNTYTGDTFVSAGTLTLGSGAQLATTPRIVVQAGAILDAASQPGWTVGANQMLGGSGTVNGSVTANGAVSPGTGTGTLTVNGDLVLAGNTYMEVTKDAGLASDMLTVNGSLTYGGRLVVAVTGSTPLAVNDTFKLFNFPGAPTGSFDIMLPPEYAWDTTQLPIDGTIRVTEVLSVTPPSIGSFEIVNGNLSFSGTGGISGATYNVVSSPDPALPLSSWMPVYTNVFGSDGSFSAVLPITQDQPKRFFRLKIP